MLSVRQLTFQAQLGVHLTDEQARAFAFVCREEEVTLSEIKAVTGLSTLDAATVADRLLTQGLVERKGTDDRYSLAQHLVERLGQADQVSGQVGARQPDLVTEQVAADTTDLVTEQVVPPPKDLSTAQVEPLTGLSALQWTIVEYCDVPRRLKEITSALGVTSRGYFKKRHLDPLIRANIVTMTNEENPRASNQRYVVTDAGARLKADRIDGDSGRWDGGDTGGE